MVEKGKINKSLSIEENYFPNTRKSKMEICMEIQPLRKVKLAIVGTREFTDYPVLKTILNSLCSGIDIIEIVSGGAKGADTLAKVFAEEKEIPLKVFLPDWDNITYSGAVVKTNSRGKKYDAVAGYRRNVLIIEHADVVFAFWNGKSKGTKHSITTAIKLKKNLTIYNYVEDSIENTLLKVKTDNYIKILRKELV